MVEHTCSTACTIQLSALHHIALVGIVCMYTERLLLFLAESLLLQAEHNSRSNRGKDSHHRETRCL